MKDKHLRFVLQFASMPAEIIAQAPPAPSGGRDRSSCYRCQGSRKQLTDAIQMPLPEPELEPKKPPEYLTTLGSMLQPEAVASAGARDDASGGAGAGADVNTSGGVGAGVGSGAGATASADAGHVSIGDDHEYFSLVGMGLTKHAAVKSALEHHGSGCTLDFKIIYTRLLDRTNQTHL